MSQPLDTTCPRCSGFENAFARFAGVNGGRCLLCNGALLVTRAQAAAFLRGAMGGGAPRGETAKLGTRGIIGTKRATVAGQEVAIEEWEVGDGFTGGLAVMTVSDVGELRTFFGVRNGTVYLESCCCGHLHDLGGMPRGLYVAEEGPYVVKARQAIRTAIQVAYNARAQA